MKLSEAIRKGAEIRPQAFGEYFDAVDTELPEDCESELCSCALGAAFEVVAGGPYFDDVALPCRREYLSEQFPVLNVEGAACPVETCEEDVSEALFFAVTHLNDEHRWLREEIADWVEQFETVNA